MKRKSPESKLLQKRQAWITRTARALNITEAAARELLATERQQSLRINPLATKDAQATLRTLEKLGWRGAQYGWLPEGYTVETGLEAIRDSALVTSGEVFIQNAASWLPVIALDPKPHETILDVCAAPGGKTSHIAALASNQAHIWANDNSKTRLAKLRATIARLQANVENYTLYDATQLAKKLPLQHFDKILLDAPCSGEGLMRIDRDKDLATWSVAQIKRLQQLQKRIITQAWQLLKPCGTIVYSTCTMAPEENEAVVDYLLRAQTDVTIVPCDFGLPNQIPAIAEWNGKPFNPDIKHVVRLKPSPTIEAFFVCKLQKRDATDSNMVQY